MVSLDISSLNDGHTESTGCEVGQLQKMAQNLRNPKREVIFTVFALY